MIRTIMKEIANRKEKELRMTSPCLFITKQSCLYLDMSKPMKQVIKTCSIDSCTVLLSSFQSNHAFVIKPLGLTY